MEKNIIRLEKEIREGKEAFDRGEPSKGRKPEDEISVEKEAIENTTPGPKGPDAKQKSEIMARYPGLNIGRSLSTRFTIMGDKTLLAFYKYSPWAMLKKSDPFKNMPFYMRPEEDVKPRSTDQADARIIGKRDNMIKAGNPCNITRSTVRDFRDVGQVLKTWTKMYGHGKRSLMRVERTLQNGLSHLEREVAKTAIAADKSDRTDVTYWMEHTKRGIRDWLDDSSRQLQQQNQDGMNLLKRELDFVYQSDEHKGFDDYVSYLGVNGQTAYSRVSIPKRRDFTEGKAFTRLSEDFIKAFNNPLKLSEAEPLVDDIINKVDELDKETLSCDM